VVPRLTLRILTAGVVTRRSAVVVVARLVQRALAVVDALSPGAADERVSPVSRWTGADGSVGPGPVEPGLALCPWSAGVGGTQVLLLEWSAADEWVSGVSPGTGAHRLVVGGLTSSATPTDVGVGFVARVLALQPDAGLVGGAVSVPGALGVAPGVGVPQEVRRTGALSSVVDCLTVGVLSTGSSGAGVLTPVQEAVALLRGTTLGVSLTLVTAALQRVTDIRLLTPADGSVVRSDLAVSVGSTRSTDLGPGEAPAVPERISCGPLGTPADGHVVPDRAVRSLTTGQRAGVHTLVVLAGSLGPTVRVLVTLPSDTAGVWVTVVAGQTPAGRSPSDILALGSWSTHPVHTGVGPAAGPAVRTADISSETLAQGSLSTAGTLGVGSTGISLTGVQSALDVGVSNVLGRTLTDGRPHVVLADGTLAAGVGGAGVEVAVGVGVSGVVGATLADGGASRGCAVGVDAAGVGGAGLQTTGGEGVTDVVGATLTDGSLTSGATLGIDSAGGLLAGVEVTLDERISFIVGTTLAHGSGSGGGAVGVDTTRGLGAGVEDAVDEGVALVSLPALADGSVPGGLAVGVDPAGVLGAGVGVAPLEGVPSVAGRTSADGSVACCDSCVNDDSIESYSSISLADGVLPAGGLGAGVGLTAGVWISFISGRTAADRPVPGGPAVGPGPAGRGEAGVGGRTLLLSEDTDR